MVILYLIWDINPWRGREDGEVIDGAEVPYLNTIEALRYLAKYVRPDIIFIGKLLRVQSRPTKGIRFVYGISSDIAKAQTVLINSSMKIKMGPMCDM